MSLIDLVLQIFDLFLFLLDLNVKWGRNVPQKKKKKIPTNNSKKKRGGEEYYTFVEFINHTH